MSPATMTFAQRFLLTLVIVLILLFALAAAGYFTGNWNEDESARPGYGLASYESRAAEPELCMDEPTRERIRVIMVDALDEALHEHIKTMFEVWMKDERGQPQRAAVGVRQAVKAHQMARKSALDWMPPACPG